MSTPSEAPTPKVKPSEVLARNVKAARALRGWDQESLAVVMKGLGHGWTYTTVSQLEGGRRRVDIDELFGLALVLDRSIPELLENTGREELDCGLGQKQEEGEESMAPSTTNRWIRGRIRLWAHFLPHEDHTEWQLKVQEIEL